jgi:hypothetical protein
MPPTIYGTTTTARSVQGFERMVLQMVTTPCCYQLQQQQQQSQAQLQLTGQL